MASILDAEQLNDSYALGKTEAQLDVWQGEIDGLVAELEGALNCALFQREIVVEAEVSTRSSRVNLLGPIIKVISITDPEDEDVTVAYENNVALGTKSYLRDTVLVDTQWAGRTVLVRYIAGKADVDDNVVSLIRKLALRNSIAGLQIATGAVTGMSVEGTSLQYGNFQNPDAKGSFSPGELSTVARLKRRVIR